MHLLVSSFIDPSTSGALGSSYHSEWNDRGEGVSSLNIELDVELGQWGNQKRGCALGPIRMEHLEPGVRGLKPGCLPTLPSRVVGARKPTWWPPRQTSGLLESGTFEAEDIRRRQMSKLEEMELEWAL